MPTPMHVKDQPAAVQVTLSCAWCARTVYNVHGEIAVRSGRLAIRPDTDRFHLSSGRPVCLECGGPLLVEDWRTVHPTRTQERPAEEAPAESRAAA